MSSFQSSSSSCSSGSDSLSSVVERKVNFKKSQDVFPFLICNERRTLAVVGPRASGKTTLVRNYLLLPDVLHHYQVFHLIHRDGERACIVPIPGVSILTLDTLSEQDSENIEYFMLHSNGKSILIWSELIPPGQDTMRHLYKLYRACKNHPSFTFLFECQILQMLDKMDIHIQPHLVLLSSAGSKNYDFSVVRQRLCSCPSYLLKKSEKSNIEHDSKLSAVLLDRTPLIKDVIGMIQSYRPCQCSHCGYGLF